MRSSFVAKCLKFNIDFKNAKKKKNQKKLFLFEIIAPELVSLTSLYKAGNACQRLSMCEQTLLGFCVSLKETFSNVTTFTVINNYCKGAAIQIATVF